jgi:hypothetical protein
VKLKRRTGSMVALIATMLALALGTAACGSKGANDAAVVGQTRYSMSYLSDMTTAYLKETGQSTLTGSDLATVKTTLITEFIVNQLTIQAADQLGVRVPDSKTSTLKAQLQNDVQYANVRKSAVIPEARLDDMVRWTLSRTAIGDKLANVTTAADSGNDASQQAAAAYVAKLAASEGVWVNPVFGKWDGQQLVVGGGALVAVPTPSPSAVTQ